MVKKENEAETYTVTSRLDLWILLPVQFLFKSHWREIVVDPINFDRKFSVNIVTDWNSQDSCQLVVSSEAMVGGVSRLLKMKRQERFR